MSPFDADFNGRNDFIHADDDDDLFRAVAKSCDAIAIAVDVDELTVLNGSIGAHDEGITEQGLAHQFDAFFRRLSRIAVDDRVVFQDIRPQADFIDRSRTAPRDDIRFRNIGNGLFKASSTVGQYVASKPRASNFLATKGPLMSYIR